MRKSLWIRLGKVLVVAILSGCGTQSVASEQNAQKTTPAVPIVEKQVVTAGYMLTAPQIDGKVDDAAWKAVPAIEMKYGFGTLKPSADAGYIKIGWDYSNIYFGMEIQDKKIVSEERPRGGPTWKDDVFEIFIDPTGRADTYYEIGLNPSGSVYDFFLVRRDGPGDPFRFMKDILPDMRYAVHVEKDKNWSAEVAIPWRDLATAAYFPPRPGETARLPGDTFRLSTGVCDVDDDTYTGSSIFKIESHHKITTYGYLQFDWAKWNVLHDAEIAAAKEALAKGQVEKKTFPEDLNKARIEMDGGKKLVFGELMERVLIPGSQPPQVTKKLVEAYRHLGTPAKVMTVKEDPYGKPGPGEYLFVHDGDDTTSGVTELERTYLPVYVEADVNGPKTLQVWYRIDPFGEKELAEGIADGCGIRIYGAGADGKWTMLTDRYARDIEWALATVDVPAGITKMRLEVNSGPATLNKDNVNIRIGLSGGM
jgi:hypothetical protein